MKYSLDGTLQQRTGFYSLDTGVHAQFDWQRLTKALLAVFAVAVISFWATSFRIYFPPAELITAGGSQKAANDAKGEEVMAILTSAKVQSDNQFGIDMTMPVPQSHTMIAQALPSGNDTSPLVGLDDEDNNDSGGGVTDPDDPNLPDPVDPTDPIDPPVDPTEPVDPPVDPGGGGVIDPPVIPGDDLPEPVQPVIETLNTAVAQTANTVNATTTTATSAVTNTVSTATTVASAVVPPLGGLL